MAADDVARALMAMDDEAVRAAVAAGDYSGIDTTGLDDAERRLLRAAATDDPDVSGFIIVCNFRPASFQCDFLPGQRSLGFALHYAKGSQVAGFQSFSQAKLAQGASW